MYGRGGEGFQAEEGSSSPCLEAALFNLCVESGPGRRVGVGEEMHCISVGTGSRQRCCRKAAREATVCANPRG